ncbi:MAG: hypothetical protein JNL83_26520 [Myxococcales bacterium]|nr:hypothetical protein [Myxococcales bacterium]
MRTLIVLSILVTAACGKSHVSRESAQAACEHQTELGFWKGFDSSVRKNQLDPAAPEVKAQGVEGLAEQRKTPEWKAVVDKCTDTFVKAATDKQVKCVMAATTSEAAQACLK